MGTYEQARIDKGSSHRRFVELFGGCGNLKHADEETLVLCQTNERAILVVVNGCIVLESGLRNGQRQVLGFRFPGDLLCTAFVGHLPNGTAHALTNVQFLKLQHRTILNRISKQPEVGRVLARVAAVQAERANLHNLVLGQLNRQERVATFLLEVALRCGRHKKDNIALPLAMTRDHIADYLGLNSDTVSRVFTQFKKSRILRDCSDGSLDVPDIRLLEKETPLTDALKELYREEERTDIDAFFARFNGESPTHMAWGSLRPN